MKKKKILSEKAFLSLCFIQTSYTNLFLKRFIDFPFVKAVRSICFTFTFIHYSSFFRNIFRVFSLSIKAITQSSLPLWLSVQQCSWKRFCFRSCLVLFIYLQYFGVYFYSSFFHCLKLRLRDARILLTLNLEFY